MQLVTVDYGNENSQRSFWHFKSLSELRANQFVLQSNLDVDLPQVTTTTSLGTTAIHKRWVRRAASFSSEIQFTLTWARWMFFQFITPLPCRQLKNSCSLFFTPRGIVFLWYKKLSCWHANFFGVVFKSATLGGRNGRLCFGKRTLTKCKYEGNITAQQHSFVFLLSILGPYTDKDKDLHTAYIWIFCPIFEQRRWLALPLFSLLNTGMAFLGP